MNEKEVILAKNSSDGILSLLDHTKQVVATIELFSQKFAQRFDKDIAVKAAILHDLGKSHPHFQRKIKKVKSSSYFEDRDWSYAHRHEISSLAFLPCFPEHDWDELIEMVIAHHKSISNDPRNRGILDLLNNDREFVDNHLQDWNNWKQHGFDVIKSFGFPVNDISIDSARKSINYVVQYCESKRYGVSLQRGLLKAADHFASAFNYKTDEQLKNLFEKPDLNFYFDENRKNDLYPLSIIPTDDSRKHTLVVAPTGAGKTDYLVKRCTGRFFYTLPFQASINAMWERFKKDIPNKDIRLLHATSKLLVKNKVEEQILQPLVGSAVKVLTPHQLAAIIFGTPGFESMVLDIAGCDIILDEIHTYSDYYRQW